jgi:glutathione synthase/RimK-type ligase-like ATP-grasp enzyme
MDLRIVVAGGSIVGAIERVAAAGEWRTNIALGGRRRPVDPPPFACMLALEAAAAAGADLVGVDLLPDGEGGWVVLELNGAVEFTHEYALDRDPFAAAAWELARVALGCPQGPVPGASKIRLTA